MTERTSKDYKEDLRLLFEGTRNDHDFESARIDLIESYLCDLLDKPTPKDSV